MGLADLLSDTADEIKSRYLADDGDEKWSGSPSQSEIECLVRHMNVIRTKLDTAPPEDWAETVEELASQANAEAAVARIADAQAAVARITGNALDVISEATAKLTALGQGIDPESSGNTASRL